MISKEQVKRVADLARLVLTESEMLQQQQDLNQILDAADRLKSVNTTDIEPTAHAIPLTNVTRDDLVVEGLSKNDAVKNGPEVTKGYFKVPQIME